MEAFAWQQVEAQDVEGMPGVTIRWVIDESRGAERFAMRVFEVEPGATIPLHSHWYEQEMFVLAGRGEAFGPDSAREVGPGAVVWVAPDEEHGFRNAGEDVLRFVCCIPTRE